MSASARALLPSALLTDDDERIWFRVQLRARVVSLQGPARAADRRDADLMWLRECAKADSEPYPDECWELNRRAWWPLGWGLA